MKDIRLIHYETDVEFSTYFINFCKMIGIYVYDQPIRYAFPPNKGLDITVVIMNSELKNIDKVNSLISSDTRCLIIEPVEDNNALLLALICDMSTMWEQFKYSEHTLLGLAEVYDKCNLMEVITFTELCIATDIKSGALYEAYDKALDIIKYDDLDSFPIDHNDEFAIFAECYLAYMYNLHSNHIGKLYPYSINNILSVLDILEKKSNGLWVSLELLIGDFHRYICEDIHEAFDHYANATNNISYNSESWRRCGNIWRFKYRDIETAMKYYDKAIEIDPYDYRTLYRIANCYADDMYDGSNAKEYFYKFCDRFKLKKSNNILNPLEYFYLFNVCIDYGSVWYGYDGYPQESLIYFKLAEQLYENILPDDKNNYNIGFVNNFWSNNPKTKSNLSLHFKVLKAFMEPEIAYDVYNWIIRLNNQMGDKEESQLYERKRKELINQHAELDMLPTDICSNEKEETV